MSKTKIKIYIPKSLRDMLIDAYKSHHKALSRAAMAFEYKEYSEQDDIHLCIYKEKNSYNIHVNLLSSEHIIDSALIWDPAYPDSPAVHIRATDVYDFEIVDDVIFDVKKIKDDIATADIVVLNDTDVFAILEVPGWDEDDPEDMILVTKDFIGLEEELAQYENEHKGGITESSITVSEIYNKGKLYKLIPVNLRGEEK